MWNSHLRLVCLLDRFRWVQCQIDAIANLRTVKAVRSALQQLPKGLDETYDNILIKVSDSDVEIVRRILLWVSFAVMPMTLTEVHEAIAVEPHLDHLDEESRLRSSQDILDLCSSLVNVTDHGYIRLAHLSVKEYLLSLGSSKNDGLSIFALEPNSANYELANNCLTYLSFNEFSSGPCATSDSYTDRLMRHPLLEYAAICWTYYVRGTKMTPDLRHLITDFFSPLSRSTFMSWVQVLNAANASWDFYPRHATPLYYASSFGLVETVADMLNDPDLALDAPGSRFGGTALHAAVLREHIPVMKLLLEAGADPNQGDWHRIYPLHTAAAYGNAEVIEMLLEYGASADVVDEEGRTPREWALRAANLESQRLLPGATEVAMREARQVLSLLNRGKTAVDFSSSVQTSRVQPYSPTTVDPSKNRPSLETHQSSERASSQENS